MKAEKLIELATPLPWNIYDDFITWSVWHGEKDRNGGIEAFDDGGAAGEYPSSCTKETRYLIIHLANNAPALVELVKAARTFKDSCVKGVSKQIDAIDAALSALKDF